MGSRFYKAVNLASYHRENEYPLYNKHYRSGHGQKNKPDGELVREHFSVVKSLKVDSAAMEPLK